MCSFNSIRSVYLVLVASSAATFSQSPTGAEEWTNLRGTNTVSAELVGIWNNKAILRLNSGRQVSVKLDDLNASSRIQAQDQNEAIARRMREKIAEVEAIVQEATAPAPKVIAVPAAAPDYMPLRDDFDVVTAMNHTTEQLKHGHFRIVVDSIPKSKRPVLDNLFKAAIRKLNATEFDQVRDTLHRIGDLVVTRQRWLFSYPALAESSPSDQRTLLDVATIIQLWATPENASFESMATNGLEKTLASLDDVASPYVHRLVKTSSMMSSMALPTYAAQPGEGDVMMVTATMATSGAAPPKPMIKVEGRWADGATPEEVEAKWAANKTQFDAIPDGSVRMSVIKPFLSSLGKVLTKLEAAKSQADFHSALDGATLDMIPAITQLAMTLPSALPAGMPGMPGSNASQLPGSGEGNSGQSYGGYMPPTSGASSPSSMPTGYPSSGPSSGASSPSSMPAGYPSSGPSSGTSSPSSMPTGYPSSGSSSGGSSPSGAPGGYTPPVSGG